MEEKLINNNDIEINEDNNENLNHSNLDDGEIKEEKNKTASDILDENMDKVLKETENKTGHISPLTVPKEEDKNKTKNIVYRRASFSRRVFANLIDFLLFVLILSSTFIGVRAIINSSEHYSYCQNYLHDMQVRSSLYAPFNDTDKRLVGVAHALELDNTKNSLEKKTALRQHIDIFVNNFAPKYFTFQQANELKQDYNEYRKNLVVAGTKDTHYFIEKTYPNGEIDYIENPDLFDTTTQSNLNMQARFFTEVYTPYSNKAQGIFLSQTPHVFEYQDYIGKMLMFVELPVSFLFGAILVYFVPPLIFRRNRYTIGKLCYKIGLVDSDYLAVKNWKIIIRQLIVIIFELVLSMFAYAVPVLLSFTMMAFSKKKQAFPDYMLGCQEVDLHNEKIYYSKEEIYLQMLKDENGPVQFGVDKKNYE